ncbi:hypothetical protein [Paracoccus litorisediminis]|uniref:Phage holin n=1 Tax=Paracoccus litorisediminis TaxID=2006130 RepID=A0A844HUU8_9RHOB|nr:hypothetical protein [Paracoccus litorisediminis]MTH62117.1 hypothetical protein [Paracoccus litorisediminis]
MQENPSGGSWFDQWVIALALVSAWFGSEAGRAALAGAAGGLVRWLMSERRRIRDLAVSIIAGALLAHYATPIMLALMAQWVGPMSGDVDGSASFAVGVLGMSGARLVLVWLETRAGKGGGNG